MNYNKTGRMCLMMAFMLLILFSNALFAAENYPICKVEWLSEKEARLTLEWKNPSSAPLMIAGWGMEADSTLRVSYQTKGGGDFATRTITVEQASFPCPIKLTESSKITEKKPLFADLPKEAEKQRAISNLYYQGILSGYPDGSFGAQKNITRAEFSKILCEALHLKPFNDEKNSPFKDIQKNWAKPYILALYEKGLVNGKTENTFDANGKVTLGEVMALLDRSFYLYSGKPATDRLAAHWSNENYLQMKGNKVVTAGDDIYQSYQPNRPATRMEVALFIARILTQKHDRSR